MKDLRFTTIVTEITFQRVWRELEDKIVSRDNNSQAKQNKLEILLIRNFDFSENIWKALTN